MQDKYNACVVLHAVGDTVGFRNGIWEFKYSGYENSNEKLYEFIDLGGVNQIDLSGWNVSDDTIMHIKTAQSLIDDYNSINTLGNNMKKRFIEAYNQFTTEKIDRYPGVSTMNSLKELTNGKNWNEIPYNLMSGGSGAAMRCLCIGLALYGENNRDKLIQTSIESSRMTNNSSVGFLGGFVSALFTALAIEKVPINNWPFILIDLVTTKVNKYIEISGRNVDEYKKDHHIFIDKWMRYIDDKFDDNKNIIKNRANKNLILRNKYYLDAFTSNFLTRAATPRLSGSTFIGSAGDDSVIIAYDSLLDAGDNWEKLIIYSMLHMGDTDTTGSIAAGLYGALYGFDHVPTNFIEHLEYKNELYDISNKLFKKFYQS